MSQVYTANRTTMTGTFSTPELAPGLAPLTGGTGVFGVSVTADGLTMILTSNATGTLGYLDLFEATRPNAAANFGAPADMANVNTSTLDETGPYILPNGSALYYVHGEGNGIANPFQIVRSASLGGESFSTGTLVSAVDINAPNAQCGTPVVTQDELTIFFAGEDRSGEPASAIQIYEAQRTSTANPFNAATTVTELNAGSDTEPHWLSPVGADSTSRRTAERREPTSTCMLPPAHSRRTRCLISSFAVSAPLNVTAQ
jgi:hypothetical protein